MLASFPHSGLRLASNQAPFLAAAARENTVVSTPLWPACWGSRHGPHRQRETLRVARTYVDLEPRFPSDRFARAAERIEGHGVTPQFRLWRPGPTNLYVGPVDRPTMACPPPPFPVGGVCTLKPRWLERPVDKSFALGSLQFLAPLLSVEPAGSPATELARPGPT